MSAAALLRRSAVLAPNDVDAHMNLGRALHNTGRYAEALAAFDRVQALKPEYPLLAFHRGLSLHYMGEFEKAVDELSRVEGLRSRATGARSRSLIQRVVHGSCIRTCDPPRLLCLTMPPPSSDMRVLSYGSANSRRRNRTCAERSNWIKPTRPGEPLVMVLRKLEREDEARKVAVDRGRAHETTAQRTARRDSVSGYEAMRSLVALLLLAGAPPEPPLFEDTAAKAGLTIKVVSGDPAEKRYLIESIGGGLAAIDYNNDGLMDLYIVNGTTIREARAGKIRPAQRAVQEQR